MDKTYDPQTLERRWYQAWEDNACFTPSGHGQPYCIMLPPPNVTGTLHMGHAFQHTLMDILIRYHRMQGFDTLWQPGTDHAGIATQIVVERQLDAKGVSRHDLGRDAFLEKVWEWKEHSGSTITRQMRRLGTSPDWSRERFTMDEGLSAAVRDIFVRMYDDGLIYRGQRLVNWDPVLKTAVSDLEVLSEEENGSLWHIRYPLADGGGDLIVATTRPETLLGDSAVAVNPEDPRYQHLIGAELLLPLTERRIPIIADDYADPAFGTGCVKITPAHDFNDYQVGQRHRLPLINVLTDEAKINHNAPARFQGLDRFEARKRIVAELEEQGLLVEVKAHKLKVPRGDRTGTVIEPFLTDQWYVKANVLAGPAIAAVKTGKIRFVPENWSKTYFEWMNNIEDWCISRQLWWGHRIPAWYDAQGKIYVAHSEAEARRKYQLAADLALTQDEDVLDTWFSSGLWPFSTLGWPQQTPELQRYYPTSVLVTGFDIIFFWVARMVMMGMYCMDGQVPFRDVYITGLVRDKDGQKMSKSKGNVLDPIDLIDGITLDELVQKRTTGLMKPKEAPSIEKATRKDFPNGIPALGTDALRFTFANLATHGRDIKFDLARCEGYRNFCNKLWNAARYVLSNCEQHDCGLHSEVELSLADQWILSRLHSVTATTHEQLQQYRFDLAAQALYDFTWNEFCDWYLELSKPVLTEADASAAQQRGTRQTLARVLEALLRLLHPFMPYITEEIWQRVAPLTGCRANSISQQPYPQQADFPHSADAEAELSWIQQVLLSVRRIRAEMNIAPGKLLPVLFSAGEPLDQQRSAANELFIKRLGRLDSLTWLAAGTPEPYAATALVGTLKVLIPMAGLIDKQAELKRLDKELERLQGEIARVEAKLNNADFIGRAPAAVVEKERAKVDDTRRALVSMQEQREKIAQL